MYRKQNVRINTKINNKNGSIWEIGEFNQKLEIKGKKYCTEKLKRPQPQTSIDGAQSAEENDPLHIVQKETTKATKVHTQASQTHVTQQHLSTCCSSLFCQFPFLEHPMLTTTLKPSFGDFWYLPPELFFPCLCMVNLCSSFKPQHFTISKRTSLTPLCKFTPQPYYSLFCNSLLFLQQQLTK